MEVEGEEQTWSQQIPHRCSSWIEWPRCKEAGDEAIWPSPPPGLPVPQAPCQPCPPLLHLVRRAHAFIEREPAGAGLAADPAVRGNGDPLLILQRLVDPNAPSPPAAATIFPSFSRRSGGSGRVCAFPAVAGSHTRRSPSPQI